MSDTQPPMQSGSDDIEFKGGWKKPEQTSGWQQPVPQEPEAQAQPGGWRMSAMPSELGTVPAREGTWHLPRPEDTRFDMEDEVEVAPAPGVARPEDSAFLETPDEETVEAPDAAVAEEEDTADLETYSGLGDLVASLTTLIEAQPRPDIVPGEDAEEETIQASEVTGESEELEFGPTQAEREALERVTSGGTTEVYPPDAVRQAIELEEEAEAAPAQDAEEAIATEVPADPAAYARQQLESLEGAEGAAVTEPEAAATQPEGADPAAYARQQLEQLGGTEAAAVTEPEADPAQVELARKFQHTERQVRNLRQQYQNGLITRDELQQELRKHLILDNDDNWWMMGVDTDTWYRYDNAVGDWVMDTPPVQPSARGVPTATSEFTADDVLRGQIPYLPEDQDQATVEDTAHTRGTEPIYLDDDMPLPRSVPIDDPEATIPGNVAINQSTIRMSDADTLDSGFDAGATVRAEPVMTSPYEPASVYEGFETVEAQPPDYEEFETESEIYQQAVERQRQSNLRRLILVVTLFLGGAFIVGTLLVLFVVVSYNNIATTYRQGINDLENYQPDFETVRVLDATGSEIAELNSEQGGSRESVSLSEMSPELIYAIVGAQDPNYYETPGFDTIAIAGAFIQNLSGGLQRREGNVNITQEVANLVVASQASTTTPTRLDEIVVASEIARQYDKNFILELYLNEQFFGNQSYGVEAASRFYFNKPASEVTLVEGAMLAALLRQPVDNDPVPKENRDPAFAATDAVLRELATVGCLNFQHGQFQGSNRYCIQRGQILRDNGSFTANVNLQRAEVQSQEYRPRSAEGDYPHFVDFVRRELIREYGNEIFQRGFIVRTTLNPEIQELAQEALRDQIQAQAFTGIQTGALMVTQPDTGAVLAMVGSPDFNNADIDGQTNYALTWQLPGATIMPVVYTRALEGVGDRNGNGQIDYDEYLTSATVLFDLPPDFQPPDLRVANAENQYRGAISVRRALANSLNVPAAKTYNFIGRDGYLDIATRLGLTFLNEPPAVDYRTAFGQVTEVRLWDMMKAYGTLANTGQFVPLRTIVEIRDSDNQVVPLPEALAPRQPAQVVQPQIAFLIQNILSDSQFYDAASAALFLENYPNRTAAKINHLTDNRDMWAIGFSRNLVVGVWMGRVDANATITNSRETALPVWRLVMENALSGTNPAPFNAPPSNVVPPGSVQNLVICAPTGTLPGDGCTQQRNEFFAITNPPPPAEAGPVVVASVDSWTGLLANEFCQNNVIQMEFVELTPRDPFAVSWLNTGAGRPTANLMGLPQTVLPLPTAACDLNTDLPVARIASPAEGSTLTGTVTILGAASASSFDSYQLEYAPSGSNNFTLIAGPVRTQQPNQNSTLGEWNTTTVPNGQYTLRMTMNSQSGGFVRHAITVNVQNPTPTPPPSPTPAPTITTAPVVVPTATTIPFFPTPAAPIPSGPEIQNGGEATPTATLFFGG